MAFSPLCLVAAGAGPFTSTSGGVNVGANASIQVKLADTSGTATWYLSVFGTDELSTAPTLTNVNPGTGQVTSPSSTVTFSFPNGLGRTVILQSTVVNGSSVSLTTTFAIYSLTAVGSRCGAVGETREGNAAYGWVAFLNPINRRGASYLFYDDSQASPTFGSNTIQGAIDHLKASIFAAGGDLSGTNASQIVVGLRGITVSATVPTTGQLLTYNGTQWAPAAPPVSFTAGGDLGGTNTNQTVVGLRGVALSGTAPSSGQLLGYNGSQWLPVPAPVTFTAAGDLSGNNASQTVVGLRGVTVSATTPSSGQLLGYNGSVWIPVPPPVTFTAAGDLSGSNTSQTVIALQGRAVKNQAPSNGQVLTWVTGSTDWEPVSPATTLPPSGAASGDLANTYPGPTVAKMQGVAISSTPPTTGQFLVYSGTQWAPTSSQSGRPAADSNTVVEYRFNESTLGVLVNYGSYGTNSSPIGPAPTTTTANYTQPASGSTVVVSVARTSGWVIGQLVTVGTRGTYGASSSYYGVTAIGAGTLTLSNLGSSGALNAATTGTYVSPGSTVLSGAVVQASMDLIKTGEGSGTIPYALQQFGPYDYCQGFNGTTYTNWNNGGISTVFGAPDLVGQTHSSIHLLIYPTKLNTTFAQWFGYSWAQSWSPNFQTLGVSMAANNAADGEWGFTGANQSFSVSGQTIASNGARFTINNWQLLSLTFDFTVTSNAIKFYRNGQQVGACNLTATGALAMGAGGYWYVGNPNSTLGDAGDLTAGLVAMVRLDNVTRSQAQIQAMWNTIFPQTANWPVP